MCDLDRGAEASASASTAEAFPCGPADVSAGRRQPSRALARASGLGLSGTHRGFSDPLHRFRCSLICRLYFYPPSPSAPGLSASTRLLMAVRRGSAFPVQLQLKASLLGMGLAVRLRPPRPSSCLPFLRFAPNASSPPAVCLPRGGGGAKGLLSPGGRLQSRSRTARRS